MKSDRSIILLGFLLILSYALTQLFSLETPAGDTTVTIKQATMSAKADSTASAHQLSITEVSADTLSTSRGKH